MDNYYHIQGDTQKIFVVYILFKLNNISFVLCKQ